MSFIRLKHLAVILLVLLYVVSAMGGCSNKHRFFRSANNQTLCLSFRKPRTLIDCCNYRDPWQRIIVTKTGPKTGVYYTRNSCKILCYNKTKGRFKLHRRNVPECHPRRHARSRRRKRRRGKQGKQKWANHKCPLNKSDLANIPSHLTCQLYERLEHDGHFYISAHNNSAYLAVRNGRVQKVRRASGKLREQKVKYRRFIINNDEDMEEIAKISGRCGGH